MFFLIQMSTNIKVVFAQVLLIAGVVAFFIFKENK